ncbi:hypothetical protein A5733_09355 [Mycobacterium sp. NS-7484]|uniref:hypothetical protein n=1 Tax=Mycobacterium sp. NS-7484 TaxID=1834161 RepID=UPI00096F23F2|nr:hypothetical protein [Mycobacterium sp. NS-7484]OMB97777.1 hypothetical protein A5733_09355 [Mycobacterium sp. NS-7484]
MRKATAPTRPDNRLALADEALLAEHHAAGMNVVIQVTWLYERAVDLDALRRFHQALGQGLLGRRIERPALPIARHRWVVDRGPSEIDIAQSTRPRAALGDWVDERSQLPVNAESGPGWHLGVVPLDDGSTAISLVLSHNLIDGLGLALVIIEGTLGKTRELGYPSPLSRTRFRGLIQDLRHTAMDVPNVGRALIAAAKAARKQRPTRGQGHPSPTRPAVPIDTADRDDTVLVPALTVYIDLADWDARAEVLGGASHTLAAAFAAKLGEHLGRTRAADGAVTLQLPISDRVSADDTRAMALSYARVTVDPSQATTDLREIRTAIKHTLKHMRETPDVSKELLWLTSFVPKRALKKMVSSVPADPDQPVFCSYLGDLSSLISQADGTVAEFANARTTGQQESRQLLDRTGGRAVVLSGRLSGKIFISVGAYQPATENTTEALRELTARTLDDFLLVGEIH